MGSCGLARCRLEPHRALTGDRAARAVTIASGPDEDESPFARLSSRYLALGKGTDIPEDSDH